jgi:hypothetical protein
MEAAGLGFFMISACLFGALYENPGSPVRQAITSTLLRRLLMGLSMGLTSIAIVYSPLGQAIRRAHQSFRHAYIPPARQDSQMGCSVLCIGPIHWRSAGCDGCGVLLWHGSF